MTDLAVQVDFNSLDFPISYACEELLENNVVSNIEVIFIYDLAIPSTLDEKTARAQIESNLLKELASSYGLLNGDICTNPPFEGLYVLKASIAPIENTTSFGESCFKLAPNATEKCASHAGGVDIAVVGPGDSPDIIDQIAKIMSRSAITARTAMRVSFLGTDIDFEAYDGGQEHLPPAVNAAAEPVQQVSNSSKPWTPLGVSMASGLCIAFFGLLLAFIARKRRLRRGIETLGIDRAHNDNSHSQCEAGTLRKGGQESRQQIESTIVNDDDMVSDGMSEPWEDFSTSYSFDMGKTMKNELLGIHGDTGVAASPGFRVFREDAESETDSWDQAGATLGSLGARAMTSPSTGEI